MNVLRRIACGVLLAVSAAAITGCDVEVDRHPSAIYYDRYPYAYPYGYRGQIRYQQGHWVRGSDLDIRAHADVR